MKSVLAAFAALVLAASSSQASVFLYSTTNPAATFPEVNTDGGAISKIDASFNDVTKAFTWTVRFSDGVSKNTGGYWLVVGPGPNPKGAMDEYAIVYFDATTLGNPTVSVYRYNGANSQSSFSTPADLLASSRDPGQTIISSSKSDAGNARTFSLTIDTTSINAKYNAGNGFPDWKGIQFGSNIGVWLHPVAGLVTVYKSSDNRLLNAFSGSAGFYDGANLNIPAPGAISLAGLAAIVAFRRRRV